MRELGKRNCGDCRKVFTATTDNEKFCMRCLAIFDSKFDSLDAPDFQNELYDRDDRDDERHLL